MYPSHSSDYINFSETIIKELKRKQFTIKLKDTAILMKERLTKDVRYQEFTEMTLIRYSGQVTG